MAELLTRPTSQNVQEFLNAIGDEQKRQDALAIAEFMREVTQAEPVMWGSSIVGFGRYHYKYASGREGDWPLVSFSPRKQNLTLYIMAGFEQYDALRSSLGKIKTGKGCIYVNRLADIHMPVLRELVERSIEHLRKTYP